MGVVRVAWTSCAVALIAQLCAVAPVLGWVDHTYTIKAVKATAPPSLDPSLSDPAWKTGVAIDNFYDFTVHQPAKFTTTAYLLYDDKFLYLAVHAQQSGVPITAVQTVDHAGVGSDDHIALNLETSGSGARVYQFRANPRGIHDELASENARFAPDWTSVTKILPNGDYNVVMVIPLSVIRGQHTPVQAWRFSVVRFIAATDDEYTSAYEPSMNAMGNSVNWPLLTGLEIPAGATRPKPHADAYALASGGSQHNLYQNGIGIFEPMNTRAVGLDVTYPFTNTLAFVGTLNPDFSNVEEDQIIIAPQEFQHQYNEYRPFFAQGANYINSLPGININSYQSLFYTPGIGVFNRGVKIEGTQGLSSIGALNVVGTGFDDSAFGYAFNEPDGSFTGSFESVLANHTGVRDDSWGYALASTNPHSGVLVGAVEQSDRGTNVTAPGQANNFSTIAGIQNVRGKAFAVYYDVGPQFNPLDGFTQVNDIKGPQTYLQYNGFGPKDGFVQSYELQFIGDRFFDRNDTVHQADLIEVATVNLKDLLSFSYSDSSSELKSYLDPYPVYDFGAVTWYDQQSLTLGYKSNTPTPFAFTYSWGPFGAFNPQLLDPLNPNPPPLYPQQLYTQQMDASLTDVWGPYNATFEYGDTIEKPCAGVAAGLTSAPAIDSQWLRRLTITRSFGKNTTLALELRNINGTGGFATPGSNIAVGFHERFVNLNELYVEYGSPANYQTVHRLIVKYIFHAGGQTGT